MKYLVSSKKFCRWVLIKLLYYLSYVLYVFFLDNKVVSVLHLVRSSVICATSYFCLSWCFISHFGHGKSIVTLTSLSFQFFVCVGDRCRFFLIVCNHKHQHAMCICCVFRLLYHCPKSFKCYFKNLLQLYA